MVPEELGIAVAEILRTEIVGLGQYTVIERGMVEQVLQEQELQLTGAVDSETAVELGKLMGAQFVIIGSIVKTGTVYTINSRVIDVETGVVKIGENVQGQGEDDIPAMIQKLTLKVIHSPAK
jgi:curli biogenesis system outer membrane secretion channel CsgG